jgi:FkbM family methyltransferase
MTSADQSARADADSALLKSLVYGVVDVCTAGRGVRRTISGEPIRLPTRWCRYYPKNYDTAKFDFLRSRCHSGDVVLDIGAHIGLFSVFMARQVGPTGRVYSFEPTPYTRQVLQDTIRLNGCDSIVEVRAEAVAGSSGVASLYDTGDIVSNANSLIRTTRSVADTPVQIVTIDEFTAAHSQNVTCIKVDVEGVEFDVLAGAAETIRRCRPVFELEVHPSSLTHSGRSLEDGWRLFEKYQLTVHHEGSPVDREWFCRRTDNFDVQLLSQPASETFRSR